MTDAFSCPDLDSRFTIKPLSDFSCSDNEADNTGWCDSLMALWNHIFDDAMALAPRAVRFAVPPSASVTRSGWMATCDDVPVGYLLAGSSTADTVWTDTVWTNTAWTDALIVHPDHQRQGIGSTLLAAAEAWARGRGYRRFRVGAPAYGLLPGIPDAADTGSFFTGRGYRTKSDPGGPVYTLAANLAAYATPDWLDEMPGAARPMGAAHGEALPELPARQWSSGSWTTRVEDADGLQPATGRASDAMLLWTEAGIRGMCRLIFEDSQQPIERVFPYRLPRPWGGIAAVITAADLPQEEAFRALLIDAALRRLHNNGINGCIIGPTPVPDDFLRFGFEPYITYRPMIKELA